MKRKINALSVFILSLIILFSIVVYYKLSSEKKHIPATIFIKGNYFYLSLDKDSPEYINERLFSDRLNVISTSEFKETKDISGHYKGEVVLDVELFKGEAYINKINFKENLISKDIDISLIEKYEESNVYRKLFELGCDKEIIIKDRPNIRYCIDIYGGFNQTVVYDLNISSDYPIYEEISNFTKKDSPNKDLTKNITYMIENIHSYTAGHSGVLNIHSIYESENGKYYMVSYSFGNEHKNIYKSLIKNYTIYKDFAMADISFIYPGEDEEKLFATDIIKLSKSTYIEDYYKKHTDNRKTYKDNIKIPIPEKWNKIL